MLVNQLLTVPLLMDASLASFVKLSCLMGSSETFAVKSLETALCREVFRSILPQSDLSKNFTHTLGTGFLSMALPLSAKPCVLGKVEQSTGCTLNP